MRSVGPGVREIRIRARIEFRIIYLASRPECDLRFACLPKDLSANQEARY